MSAIFGRAAFRATRPLRFQAAAPLRSQAEVAADKQASKNALKEAGRKDPELYVRPPSSNCPLSRRQMLTLVGSLDRHGRCFRSCWLVLL